MAIPTITSIAPAKGHTGGGGVVRIVGTNFQQVPAPPISGGPLPAPPATVRVFVGGTEARRVRVVSETLLFVTLERRDPGKLLDVEVRNVGPFGETIGAELATLAGAFEYSRPMFTETTDHERVVRALIAELQRQVFPEVVITAHVDWSEPLEALRQAAPAPMPCVVLAGPTLRPNRFFATNVRPTVELEAGITLEHRAPHTDDLVFTLGAISDHYATLLSMTAALRNFALRTTKLQVPVSDGATEFAEYELVLEGDIVVASKPDENNVRTSAGTIAVLGVDTLTAPGFENDQATTVSPEITEVELNIEPTSE